MTPKRIVMIMMAVLVATAGVPAVAARQTGRVSGLVVDDTGRPVRLAVVTIRGGGLPQELATVTDDDGRFALGDLPAGQFTLSAAKKAYVSNAWGAKRPGRRGTPLTLSEAESRTDLRLVLPRGAVITGRVFGLDGESLEGVEVSAFRSEALDVPSDIILRPETVTTDDRGVYRVFGLAPGEYLVSANVRITGIGEIGLPTAEELDADFNRLRGVPGAASAAGARPAERKPAMGFAPTYHPGTASVESATRFQLAPGDERTGVDFAVVMVPMGQITGTVTTGDGSPLPQVRVSISGGAPRTSILGGLPSGGAVGPDGRFEFRAVPPGRYTLTATTLAGRGRGAAPEPPRFARGTATVDGNDVAGLVLTLQPGLHFAGQVRFDATTLTPPEDLTTLRASLFPEAIGVAVSTSASGVVTVLGSAAAPRNATLDADGRFDLSGQLPGRYFVSVSLAPTTGWWLRSAMAGGRDLADDGLELDDADVTGVVITYTDRHSALTGVLETAGGAPAADYFMVVVPADRSLWRPNARRIRSTRPDTSGAFEFRDLPAGGYLLAALTDVEPSDLGQTTFLEQVAAQAIPVTIRDGETTEQRVRIAGGGDRR